MRVSGQQHSTTTTSLGKEHEHPLNTKLNGPHRQSQLSGGEKNHFPTLALQPYIIQPVS